MPRRSKVLLPALSLVFQLLGCAAAHATAEPCRFDDKTLEFDGKPVEQAACLLRPVGVYGEIGHERKLPPTLASLAGEKVALEIGAVRRWLTRNRIAESDLGGDLAAPLGHAGAGDPKLPQARYFIIHDTSTPNYEKQAFPNDIDLPSWKHNELGRWTEGAASKAHVFVNRVGGSVTAVDLGTPWRATKFERDSRAKKGLFIHVENVQPRRSLPAGAAGNDALAPTPGFTTAQYERLALIYLAASIRRGTWLVPAFHGVLDLGHEDRHDDPQNFDLEAWDAALGRLVAVVQAQAELSTAKAEEIAGDSWEQAEYAVRWDIRLGGPRDSAAVIEALYPDAAPSKKRAYGVRYYDWALPPVVPDKATPILRERESNDPDDDERFQLTYKVRSEQPLKMAKGWCPLPGAEEKLEVDVSAANDGSAKSTYSYSCTLSSKDKMPGVPPMLSCSPKPCEAKMTRDTIKVDGAKIKVERWSLPAGEELLEVSRAGKATPEDMGKFQQKVVKPLVALGVVPIIDGKTSAASDCKAK